MEDTPVTSSLREWLNTVAARQNAELATERDIWKAEAERLAQGYTMPDFAPGSALPLQPIEYDSRGTIRFRENRVVRHLLDYATGRGCGLNELARLDFSPEERMQFAQLIGYSVSGYGDLSYASEQSVATADAIAAELAKVSQLHQAPKPE